MDVSKPCVAFSSALLSPRKSCSTLIPPGSVNKEARQVKHKQGGLQVGGEEWLVEVLLLENVLGQLGGANPDDVHQEKSENTQRQSLCPCGRAQALSGHVDFIFCRLCHHGLRNLERSILKTLAWSPSELLTHLEQKTECNLGFTGGNLPCSSQCWPTKSYLLK